MSLASVLIPSYNYSEFIAEAVASVVGQTYGDLELVVVDDFSTDGSFEVAQALQDLYRSRFARFDVLRLPRNGGVNRLLNSAIPQLRGEVTCILDADDCLEPDYVAETLRALLEARARRPRAAFAYTDCTLVDTECAAIGEGRSGPFDPALLAACSYIPGCGLTLTLALRASLPLDARIKVGTKHHRWRRIVDAGYEGLHVDRPLFRYRLHERNLSGIGRRLLAEPGICHHPKIDLSRHWPTARMRDR